MLLREAHVHDCSHPERIQAFCIQKPLRVDRTRQHGRQAIKIQGRPLLNAERGDFVPVLDQRTCHSSTHLPNISIIACQSEHWHHNRIALFEEICAQGGINPPNSVKDLAHQEEQEGFSLSIQLTTVPFHSSPCSMYECRRGHCTQPLTLFRATNAVVPNLSISR